MTGHNISSISSKSIFLYCVIICFSIVYFRNINVTLGTLTGLILVTIIIVFLYYQEILNISNAENLHDLKVNNIVPQTENIKKFKDITDFIFSIQELYEYNPQAFEELVIIIDEFLEIYGYVILDYSLAGEYYSQMEQCKVSSINRLHSLIFTVPSSKLLIQKLNNSMEVLENLLNKYLLEIYDLNKNYVGDHGFYNNTKYIELNVKPFDTIIRPIEYYY